MEVVDAIDVAQRPLPLAVRDQINNILQSNEDTRDLQVVGIKFNAKGNCITIAHPNTSIEKLATHIDKIHPKSMI